MRAHQGAATRQLLPEPLEVDAVSSRLAPVTMRTPREARSYLCVRDVGCHTGWVKAAVVTRHQWMWHDKGNHKYEIGVIGRQLADSRNLVGCV